MEPYTDGSFTPPLPLEGIELVDFAPSDSEEQAKQVARAGLTEHLKEQKKVNAVKVAEMGRLGARLAETAVVMARVETLIAMLLDADAKLGFEIAFEGHMSTVLDEALTQVRQANLLSPGNGSGLLRP